MRQCGHGSDQRWHHHRPSPRQMMWMMGAKHGWMGGGRARRGDVRAAILALLSEGPMHGYQIIQELESRSGGAWRPSPGSVYPTLQLLADEGLVTSEEVGGKRVFSLTDAGRARWEEDKSTGATPWDEVAGGSEEGSDLRNALFQLGAAVVQVGQTGSAETRAATVEILNEARKKVYGLLADSE